MNASCLVLW